MTRVIAHRGASAYEVENSLAAFRAAVDLGADGVELDVHATADGIPIVHHDDVAGAHRISVTRYSELGDHSLANGETIPTLASALSMLGTNADAYVELKTLPPDHDDALLEVLDGGPAPQRCHVHSFDHRIVSRIRAKRPDLPAGVLSTSYPVNPVAQLIDASAGELWQAEHLIDRELVGTVQARGFHVYAWTVDDPARMRQLVALGVDAICTNRPDVAREVVG
jgi:glycerophosphoryl diester phosphodiesterase